MGGRAGAPCPTCRLSPRRLHRSVRPAGAARGLPRRRPLVRRRFRRRENAPGPLPLRGCHRAVPVGTGRPRRRRPRVNLLLADDVGLGKTVEAGLVAEELRLRGRAHRVMVVCPAGLTLKWRDEMADKFGLDFTVVDSACCAELRRTHSSAANPFRVFPLTIVSLPGCARPKRSGLSTRCYPREGRRSCRAAPGAVPSIC
ncbi:SNF2-related protein [Streptomyces sp. AD16]|nr:SNF2-related protein [Streptomyces sp. AD16]